MITIKTLAEWVVAQPGFNRSANKKQIQEVLRMIGLLMRTVPEEEKQEIIKAIVLGNKRLSEKIL